VGMGLSKPLDKEMLMLTMKSGEHILKLQEPGIWMDTDCNCQGLLNILLIQIN
jgi:hypothetical protein